MVGGNGSGKTTLIKLLAGLYLPTSGSIDVDDAPVTEEALESYRQHFSVVFADFYLFDELLGLSSPEHEQKALRYLQAFELDHKVTVRDGAFTTSKLSHGQRKRLALLTAYLEDRPIYIFDEWAAGQDPLFTVIFYKQLLPELKRRGKLVIVVTHDDRYFHLADRVIKLEYGCVVFDEKHPDISQVPVALYEAPVLA